MRRPNRPRSADLDRLLDEDVSDGTALAQLLAAARAPGAANELVGLSTAMSAFASANRELPRSPVSHRAAPRRALTTRSLLAKTVAAVGGVTLAGGVAYAATTVGFMGLGGGSDHPPALHSTSPGHGGDQDRSGGSSPFGSTAPGAATATGATPARTHAATPSHGVGKPASSKTRRPGPTRPTQSVHSTHASPTRPAPSSDVTPPAPGRTSHPTHSPTPSHRAPATRPPAPRA
ncbi:hypothetical protein [Jatrophihabitans sp.]|uniref:hypothetical protein n=1 Tax=Jatrophihabitans sp. TaxID=1932789 RepID=UPI003916DC4B